MRIPYFALLLATLSFTCLGSLEMVIVISRHAARSPLNFVIYPGVFKERRGEITNAGLRQAYLMGRHLRKVYVDEKKFLTPKFHNDELYVKSSSAQRCYLTAIGVIYGLFGQGTGQQLDPPSDAVESPLYKMIGHPPFYTQEEEQALTAESGESNNGDFIFPGGLPAVHVRVTNEKHNDMFFHAHKAYVFPLVKKIQQRIKQTEFFQNYSRKVLAEIGPQVVAILNEERRPLGEPDLTVEQLTMRKLKRIYDGYKVFSYHKSRLPPFPKKLLKKLHELQFFYVYHVKYGDHFIKRATVSQFYRELHELIQGHLFQKTTPHKFLYYSCHDSNLEAFLTMLLKIEELRSSPDFLPPFGSMIAIEIHRKDETAANSTSVDDYFVKFIFNKKALKPKHCGEKAECELSFFLHLLEKNHIPNLGELCQSPTFEHAPKIKSPFTCTE